MMGENISVSVLTVVDENTLEELCRMETECFGDEAWSRESIRGFAENPDVITVTVRVGGELAAMAAAIVMLDEAEITKAAVSAGLRRRGFARLALQRLTDECRSRGVGRLLLEVRDGNAAARGLYTSLGFSPYSVRRGYYACPREDAIMMERRI